MQAMGHPAEVDSIRAVLRALTLPAADGLIKSSRLFPPMPASEPCTLRYAACDVSLTIPVATLGARDPSSHMGIATATQRGFTLFHSYSSSTHHLHHLHLHHLHLHPHQACSRESQLVHQRQVPQAEPRAASGQTLHR